MSTLVLTWPDLLVDACLIALVKVGVMLWETV